MEHKTIGAGIIAVDEKTGDILLGRRSFQSPQPNSWAPFGGTFELKDGNPKTTAKREFSEETKSDEPYEISSSPFYVQNRPHLTFYNYLGIFGEKFNPTMNKEHLAFGWFPIDSLPSNLHPGFKELIDRKGEILKKVIEKIKTEPDEQIN